jgi:hypothetical protein
MPSLIDPWVHVHGHSLQTYKDLPMADAFSDVLWQLDETEHGCASGERLGAFTELLAHVDRTPELDEQLFIPFLIRYLWEVPYPLYTCQAWHTLELMVGKVERLRAVAHSILEHHPHGDLRAAVLQMRSNHVLPQYLLDKNGTALIVRQLQADQHPTVRAACADTLGSVLDLADKSAAPALKALTAALTDACEEVRCAAFSALAMYEHAHPDIHAAMTAAVRAAANTRVLPRMLDAVASSWMGCANLSGLAAILDALAAQRQHVLWGDLCKRLAWLLRQGADPAGPVLKDWLPCAPFGDGENLEKFLLVERDAGRPESRAAAWAVLRKIHPTQGVGDVYQFLLNTPQTPQSLAYAAQIYAFWNSAFTRVHLNCANARQRFEQLHALSVAVSQASADPEDAFKQTEPWRNILYSRALAYSLFPGVDAPAAQNLMDAVLLAIAADPGVGANPFYPLSENLEEQHAVAKRDWRVLAQLIQTVPDRYLAQSAAQELTKRYAACVDPAILSIIESWFTPDQDLSFAAEVVGELPARLADDLPAAHRKRLELAVQRIASRTLGEDEAHDEWLIQRVRAWLE